MWVKKYFRLIVMIATDNKIFWIELNLNIAEKEMMTGPRMRIINYHYLNIITMTLVRRQLPLCWHDN